MKTRGLALALALRRDPPGTCEALAREHGDIVEVRLPFRRLYLLNHPSHVQQVLVTGARHFTRGLAIDRARLILGGGLLTSDGDEHRRQRRLMQPAFHRHVVAGCVSAMGEAARARAARWTSGEPLDVAREMMTLALSSMIGALSGERQAEDGREVSTALEVLFDLSPRLLLPGGPVLMRLPLPSHIRFMRARAAIEATVSRLLERSRDGRSGGLLARLRATENGEAPLSGRELHDQATTLLLAGHETTACALAWTWHLLAEHPEAEARLHEELDRVLGGRLPDAADVSQLVFTERVFAEAMRLYPPVWSIGRRTAQPVAIDGRTIAAGSYVMVNPWVVHRDPRFWPDPLRFDPDRFSPEAVASRPREAYFPFGDGRRRCIGEPLAWLLGVAAIAAVAQQVRLRPDPRQEILPLTYLFLLHPGFRHRGSADQAIRGLPMRVSRR